MERVSVRGKFIFLCFDCFGNLRWENRFSNLVTYEGKNNMFNTFFSGSAYTAAGPYIGLISSVSYSAIAPTDTMASHPGWTEAGVANAPTYSGNRPALPIVPAVGGVVNLSNFVTFNMTSLGTIKGGFICAGSGATNAIGGTAGWLWSAGLFQGGDNLCHASDIVYVGYQTSM